MMGAVDRGERDALLPGHFRQLPKGAIDRRIGITVIGVDGEHTRLHARRHRTRLAINLSNPRLADIDGDATKTVSALASRLGGDKRLRHRTGILRQNAVALKDRGYEILRLCD
ncbi:hypothetical protein D3C86_1569590 [compost metagenome]